VTDTPNQAPNFPLPNPFVNDLAKTKELSALYCNRMYVLPQGTNLRVALGEVISGDSKYHSAVVISAADALEMGRLLVRMANDALGIPNPYNAFGTPPNG
jgi:hypothetical protein